MILCSCNVLSDRDICAALAGEACRPSVGALFRGLGLEPKCGRCAKNVAAAINGVLGSAAASCDEQDSCAACVAGERTAA